jgi:hypothetical protein
VRTASRNGSAATVVIYAKRICGFLAGSPTLQISLAAKRNRLDLPCWPLVGKEEATEKRCRDMIAKHHRKPWWRKIGRETELRDMILAEWSAFSKWMDDRIAFMRKANEKAEG